MWRSVVRKNRVASALNYNKPLHLFSKSTRAGYSDFSTQSGRHVVGDPEGGRVVTGYNHPSNCFCCQKRPLPLWHTTTSRQFSSSSNDDDTVEEKSGDDDANGAVTFSEDAQTDLGIPGAQKGGKKLAIIFTCTVCNTRSAKQFTENAYRNGVVVVTCPGCQNRHLIADNLSFFSDDDGGWNIEKAMAKLGQNVDMVTKDNVMELSMDQVIGGDYVKAVVGSEADEEGDGKHTSS